MGILFVCRGNVMRSQIAEACFNQHGGSIKAVSAGTEASRYGGRRLRAYAHQTIACMREIGIDISDNVPKQITAQMVDGVQRVIVMADRDTWPHYLTDSDKVEFWDVKDPRRGGYEDYVRARDEVIERVNGLLGSLHII